MMNGASVQTISIAGEGGSLYQVEVGATFLTGIEVDVAAALVDPSEVGPSVRLEQSMSIPFKARRAVLKRDDGRFYAINGSEHGTEIVPRTLASVDPKWVLENCDHAVAPVGWILDAAECDIHDFGVAMIILSWQPAEFGTIDVSELDGLLQELNLASQKAVASLPRQITTACQAALSEDPARLDLALARGLDLEEIAVLPPAGEILWLWHMVLVAAPKGDQVAVARNLSAIVCPNDYEILAHRDHALAAGVHASVACSVQGREGDAYFLIKAPRLLDAWWTLFWRLDRILLALQLRLESSIDAHAPEELRKRAAILSEVSSRVNLLRSRLDSFLVSSGARDIAAWDVLGKAWDMPYRVGVVDKKMTLLSNAYRDAVAQITNARISRVNFMIYVFTAFSLVASVVAVAQFAQGGVDQGLVVRLIILFASVAAALAAVILSVRTSRMAKSRTTG